MNTSRILEDQVIHVKRGRANSFGFEPAWNAYFDFYLSTKYFDESLLELEDVAFHLLLRKNLNDRNPDWKMPSIRQFKKGFGIGKPRSRRCWPGWKTPTCSKKNPTWAKETTTRTSAIT